MRPATWMTKTCLANIVSVCFLVSPPGVAEEISSNDHPDLSPDGRTLAFDGGFRGSKNLYLLDLATGECSLLLDTDGDLGVPSWSRDGSQLAFNSKQGRENTISVVNVSTGAVTPLASSGGEISTVAWSAYDEFVVFAKKNRGKTTELVAVQLSGKHEGAFHNARGSQRYPFWSLRWNAVLFTSDESGFAELHRLNLDFGEQKQITNDGEPKYVPRASSDGRRISYAAHVDGHFDIFVMNSNGSEVRNLTNSPGHDLFATWAPDSQTIYFESTRDRGNLSGDNGYDLYSIDVDSGEVTRLTTPETCPSS